MHSYIYTSTNRMRHSVFGVNKHHALVVGQELCHTDICVPIALHSDPQRLNTPFQYIFFWCCDIKKLVFQAKNNCLILQANNFVQNVTQTNGNFQEFLFSDLENLVSLARFSDQQSLFEYWINVSVLECLSGRKTLLKMKIVVLS